MAWKVLKENNKQGLCKMIKETKEGMDVASIPLLPSLLCYCSAMVLVLWPPFKYCYYYCPYN